MEKISRFCDGVMEAAWLAAIIVSPLFFNVLSSRIFEPDKIALLRVFAIITLLAWIIKLVVGGVSTNASHKKSLKVRDFLKTPLMLPVLFLVIIYLVATVFSIVPKISLNGSYQRMQGTYTTFSYLVFFFAIAINLRQRVQLERILTALILTSLPVALYGMLQHYQLDPVPWGGDVSRRITSSLGNSIFLAAYLIMVFPLTVGRLVGIMREILVNRPKVRMNTSGRISTSAMVNFLLAALYAFIAAVQVIALYFSGSRGPVLGWMAALFFILLMLTVYWRKKWATLVVMGLSLVGVIFMLLFNIAGGPFEKLRSSPVIGRYGLLLNAESNSALVRRYIWEGAVELVKPHAALEFPDGSKDRFNSIRPLVGYGPESMFVAYTPFYVPELGIVERRNATPDRSHNETWDALVTGGLFGLFVYLWIFLSVFYYGLKWMNLIQTDRERWLFFGLCSFGGLAGGVFISLWRGIAYLGVGIPFGIFLGILLFIILKALVLVDKSYIERQAGENNANECNERMFSPAFFHEKFLILLVLLAAILAHFVEINFGIAIATTRLYFWVYSALLLVIGTNQLEQISEVGNTGSGIERSSKKQKTRKDTVSYLRYMNESILGGLILGLILMTLGYNFLTNPTAEIGGLAIIWQSFTTIRGGALFSTALLGMLALTWFIGIVIQTGEIIRTSRMSTPDHKLPVNVLARLWISVGGISLVVGLAYILWHAESLATIAKLSPSSLEELKAQILNYTKILSSYWIFLVILVLIVAYFLAKQGLLLRAVKEANTTRKQVSMPRLVAGMAGFLIILFISTSMIYSNLKTVQADMVFKLADNLSGSGGWPAAIEIYKLSNQLAPQEDYYYIFLSKAYLEQAQTLVNEYEIEQLFQKAEKDLQKAQSINPLNIDHTSNLGRLFSLWASKTEELETKSKYLEKSDYYFSRAVVLSPNNVRLWNEWAYLAFRMGDSDQGLERLEQAQRVDPTFDWTYTQFGDYFQALANQSDDDNIKAVNLRKAIGYYRKSLELNGETAIKYNTALSLASAAIKLDLISEAIQALEKALVYFPQSPNSWRVHETLAQLYLKSNDRDKALENITRALELAPSEQKEQLKNIYQSILPER